MAIALQARVGLNKSAFNGNAVVSITTLTIPAGSNQILLVTKAGAGNHFNAETAFTWNGVSMTRLPGTNPVGGVSVSTGGNAFYLVNPAQGNFTLAITTPDQQNLALYEAFVFSGVDTASPIAASLAEGNTSVVNWTSGATVAAGNVAVLSVAGTMTAMAVGANTTGTDVNVNDSNARLVANGYSAPGTVPSFTWTGAAQASAFTVVLKAAATSTTNLTMALVGDDAVISGSLQVAGTTSLTMAIVGDEAVISGSLLVGAAPGTITSPPLKDNTGVVQASTALNHVAVYNVATGDLVVRLTGLSTNGAGVFTATHASIVPGTSYRLDWELANSKRRMPIGLAA